METFDLNQTARLAELFELPRERRDDAWRENFFAAVPNASLATFDPQVMTGPDGYPYFQLAIPDPGEFTPFSIVHLLEDILRNGVGVVIFPSMRRDGNPAWVFSYGEMVSYSMFQNFQGDPQEQARKRPPPPPEGKTLARDTTFLRANPSEQYLPKHLRAVLGQFVRGQFQHPDPRIGLVSSPVLSPPTSLMVNIRLRDCQGNEQQLRWAMDRLLWFLPRTYSIMPLPDDWSDNEMAPL